MMEILKDLYFGNIRPSERAIRKGSDYQKAEEEVSALEDAFRAELSAEGKRVYGAYVSKRMSLLETDDCDSFIKGYRLGVKLMLAVLLDYDTPLPQVGEE